MFLILHEHTIQNSEIKHIGKILHENEKEPSVTYTKIKNNLNLAQLPKHRYTN